MKTCFFIGHRETDERILPTLIQEVEQHITEYGVTDAEVIGAIACHCTGKPGMNTLDKLIFCADMLEPARDFDGVEELRRTIRRDFEKGFRACLIRSYDYLVEKGADIYPLTLRAAEYYRND